MRWAFLIAVVVSIGCGRSDSTSAPPPTQPQQETFPYSVIVVDSFHVMIDERKPTKPYLVKADKGLVIDGRKFTFRDPDRLARVPNAVQILYETSEFAAAWEETGKRVVTLDASTLTTLKGPVFEGFGEGKRGFIAVGYQSIDPQTKKVSFSPFWVASVIFH